MKRLVLFKPRDAGAIDPEELTRIGAIAHVVDAMGTRAFLVDVEEDQVDALRRQLAKWTVSEERFYQLPEAEP